jgi:hypothetical protein
MAMRVLALALVAAQGMPRGKSFINADSKHRYPLGG